MEQGGKRNGQRNQNALYEIIKKNKSKGENQTHKKQIANEFNNVYRLWALNHIETNKYIQTFKGTNKIIPHNIV